ncbi:hypothetical protein HDV63DRAFT_208101 [Trichoderma sp. SZMC 28014]
MQIDKLELKSWLSLFLFYVEWLCGILTITLGPIRLKIFFSWFFFLVALNVTAETLAVLYSAGAPVDLPSKLWK